MSQALSSPASCCSPCEDQPTTQIPGPPGDSAYQVALDQGFVGTEAEWLASLDGADGENAFTALTANFTQPAVDASDDAEVANSDWITVGQDVFLEGGGYYLATAKPDATHVTLKNLGYDANAAPASVIPSGSHLGPAGEKGEPGAAGGGGDMLGASNLGGVGGVADPAASLVNLGGSVTGRAIFVVTSPSAIRFLRVNADNTVTLLSDSAMRTALGLAVGTDVQAFDAFLTSIATLGTAANKIIYTTGVNTAAESGITADGRTLIASADFAAMRTALGKVLPRYGLLGSSAAVNLNTPNNDNSITIAATTYRIDKVVIVGLANAAAATGGVFTAAGGAGTTLALDQALSTVNASGKFMDLVLEAVVGTDVQTASPLRFRTGTAAGGAATANVFIFGWDLS